MESLSQLLSPVLGAGTAGVVVVLAAVLIWALKEQRRLRERRGDLVLGATSNILQELKSVEEGLSGFFLWAQDTRSPTPSLSTTRLYDEVALHLPELSPLVDELSAACRYFGQRSTCFRDIYDETGSMSDRLRRHLISSFGRSRFDGWVRFVEQYGQTSLPTLSRQYRCGLVAFNDSAFETMADDDVIPRAHHEVYLLHLASLVLICVRGKDSESVAVELRLELSRQLAVPQAAAKRLREALVKHASRIGDTRGRGLN